jgi:23S rRNA (cytosine1962-C5)-methyltransferase
MYHCIAMKKYVTLKKSEEKRLLDGHQWIFSNEIKDIKGNPEAGDIVEIHRVDGKYLGLGFFHLHSLIAVRFLTENRDEAIDAAFFEKRIHSAYELRKRLYPDSETFRLVYGESDFLPGLIIDKYNDYLVLQTFSLGMEKMSITESAVSTGTHRSGGLICNVLQSLFQPKGIVERNDSPLRILEGMSQQSGILCGEISPTVISDGVLQFHIDVLRGQKTGFYLDQRENRIALRRYVKNCRVLDCFCNEGGFALHAAHAGAAEVVGIDISETAIEKAQANAVLNGIPNCRFEVADVFEKLRALIEARESYNVVILDPPSFTKSKKTVLTARKGYIEINTNAMRLLSSDGVLATASCSHHIDETTFLEIIRESAQRAGKELQLLEWRGATPDHPVLPAMPETKYLKFGIFHVIGKRQT